MWAGRRIAAASAVVVISLACLGAGLQKSIIASAYTDPVSRIRAQDESVYSHAAIRMAEGGPWLTPRFLGRYFLYKPPLLVWLSALSMKMFGLSLWALRLPVLAAGSLGAALAFWWAGRMPDGDQGPSPGFAMTRAIAASAMMVSNGLWHVYSRINQTDALVVAFITAAVCCVAADPQLERWTSSWGFATLTAAALMTKSIAGLLAPLIFMAYCGLVPKGRRPPLARLAAIFAIAALLAAPWHIYQILVHGQWFWAEYVKLQIFGFGLNPPSQTSQEWQIPFYVRRLVETDPALVALSIVAAPAFIRALRKRAAPQDALLAAWILVGGGSVLLFRYRNLHYLLTLIPALCILAAAYGPVFQPKRGVLALITLAGLFAAKANFREQPWGLDFAGGDPPLSAAALREYARRGRANELIIVSPDDNFYSAVLPLAHVRYCFIDSLDRFAGYGPHFVYLGITLPAAQFAELDHWRTFYEKRMAAWKLDSSESLATAIVAASQVEVLRVIAARPGSDFFLPDEMRAAVEPLVKDTHEILDDNAGRIFLLALHRPVGGAAGGPGLPAHW